jgi:hypothetical protein
VDISGKGGRIRTVPVPDWVEAAFHAWLWAAGIAEGRIFRSVSRWGSVVGEKLSALVLDSVLSDHSRRAYSKALDDFLAFLGPRPFTRRLCRSLVPTWNRRFRPLAST